ncbi:MAG TPA: hypothetical protein VLI92_00180 [Candidatus Saccharimonadales bacterium]|nr:hypothetical protein [Candidatus Saccharimonadales bacterium]
MTLGEPTNTDKSLEQKTEDIETLVLHSGNRNRWTDSQEDFDIAKTVLEKNGRKLIDCSINADTTGKGLAESLAKQILGAEATADTLYDYIDDRKTFDVALIVSSMDTTNPELKGITSLIRYISDYTNSTVLVYTPNPEDITKATELARIVGKIVY